MTTETTPSRMNAKQWIAKNIVSTFALIVAVFAFLAALDANKEANQQNNLAAISAQIQACISLSVPAAKEGGMSKPDADKARTKAQDLSRCLGRLEDSSFVETYSCAVEVNKKSGYVSSGSDEQVC